MEKGRKMPIPELDHDGFLPPGIHECSLNEIRDRFGRYKQTDRRTRLFEKLSQFAHEARKTGMVEELVVDGSFVTAEPNPEDVDLIIGVSATHDFAADLRPFEYNVLSKRRVRKVYGFDILGVAIVGTELWQGYVDFFQKVKNRADRQKGILKVKL